MAGPMFLLHAFLRFLRRVVLCDFFDRIIELISSFVKSIHRRQVALLIETVLRSLEEADFVGFAAFLHAHCLHLWLGVSLEACQRTLVELHIRIFWHEWPFFLGVSTIDKSIIALSILIVVEILSFPYDFNLVLLL